VRFGVLEDALASAVGRAILGSVSQRLLLEAPIPVLVVKINEHQG
jgi:hypothetical protein